MKNDKYSYKGWLVSDHWLKRSLAVYGHSLLAQLVIGVGVVALYVLAGLMGWAAVSWR